MKRLVLLCMLLMAPAAILADGLKIGVVNVPRILEESPQAEAARNELQQEFAPREEKLHKLQQDIHRLEERMARDSAIMSENERKRLERDIVAKKREFQREQQAFGDDLNFKRNEVLSNLQRELVSRIQSFAEQQGYDVLLAEGVVYVKDTLDVTEQVLQHLRKK